MGAVAGLRGLPKMSSAALARALLSTGPGPDAGGVRPGPSVFDHSRDNCGTDAALCAKAGVAAIAANDAHKRKFPRRLSMRMALLFPGRPSYAACISLYMRLCAAFSG